VIEYIKNCKEKGTLEHLQRIRLSCVAYRKASSENQLAQMWCAYSDAVTATRAFCALAFPDIQHAVDRMFHTKEMEDFTKKLRTSGEKPAE
jgi:hypothetical protein